MLQRPEQQLNFPLSDYKDRLEELRSKTLDDLQAELLVRIRTGVTPTSRYTSLLQSPRPPSSSLTPSLLLSPLAFDPFMPCFCHGKL